MGSSVYDLSDNTALYEVLGVPRTATDKDIRRAYLKLVVVYHPDKNPDGEEIFKEICFAHGVLSDPQQRAMYDNQSLRRNLQGRAKEYDPAMDPRAQLSPEDLRKFVEKLEADHASKMKEQSDFDRLRDEEMQRRAEFDAKNPAFKLQYERQRKLRQEQAAAMTPERTTGSAPRSVTPSATTLAPVRTGLGGGVSGLKGYRTSAELTAALAEDERNRLYGLPPITRASASPSTRTPTTSTSAQPAATAPATTTGSPPSLPATSVRQQMMSKYRTEHAMMASGGSTNSSRSSGTPNRNPNTRLDFVKDQNDRGFYSQTVDDAIRTYSHFDYLDYVTADRRDQEPIAGAVIADALDSYVRKPEDPQALD